MPGKFIPNIGDKVEFLFEGTVIAVDRNCRTVTICRRNRPDELLFEWADVDVIYSQGSIDGVVTWTLE